MTYIGQRKSEKKSSTDKSMRKCDFVSENQPQTRSKTGKRLKGSLISPDHI